MGEIKYVSEDPYDEKNIQTSSDPGFRVHARIEPSEDEPGKMDLTLSVSDGPECFRRFAPGDLDEYGENGLTRAIAEVTNAMIREAQCNEAGCWIENHREVCLVKGSTGSQVWIVRAFLSKRRADAFVRELVSWCIERGVDRVAYEDPERRRVIDPEGKLVKCPLDPQFRVEATGVSYHVDEAPMDMFDPADE